MLVTDTDVMVDVLREHPPAIAWLASLGDEQIVLPGYVMMELLQGCRNQGEQRAIERRLAAYAIAWPSAQVCDSAVAVFARYHLSHNLGILDALIGQLAVSLGRPLYTFSQRHYAASPGLATVQPY